MTDDQLRLLIRDAIGRHLGAMGLPGRPAPAGPPPAASIGPSGHPVQASAQGGLAIAAAPGAVVQLHISHATFSLPAMSDGTDAGPCDMEPHGQCTKCGFCQSYGH